SARSTAAGSGLRHVGSESHPPSRAPTLVDKTLAPGNGAIATDAVEVEYVLQALPDRLRLIGRLRFRRDLIHERVDLVRHLLAELRCPLGPRQRKALDEKLRSGGIRGDRLFILRVRLHVDHHAAVPENHPELLQSRRP